MMWPDFCDACIQDLAVVVLLILIPLLSPNSSKGGVCLKYQYFKALFAYLDLFCDSLLSLTMLISVFYRKVVSCLPFMCSLQQTWINLFFILFRRQDFRPQLRLWDWLPLRPLQQLLSSLLVDAWYLPIFFCRSQVPL